MSMGEGSQPGYGTAPDVVAALEDLLIWAQANPVEVAEIEMEPDELLGGVEGPGWEKLCKDYPDLEGKIAEEVGRQVNHRLAEVRDGLQEEMENLVASEVERRIHRARTFGFVVG